MKICNCLILEKNPNSTSFHRTETNGTDWCSNCGYYCVDYDGSQKMKDPNRIKKKNHGYKYISEAEKVRKKVEKFKKRRDKIIFLKTIMTQPEIERAMNLSGRTIRNIVNMSGTYGIYRDHIKE